MPASARRRLMPADSGDGAPCPDDAYEPTTTVCRPAGDCDVEERCAGWSPNCPEDALKTSSTICRPHQGVCDRHERCTGNSPTCPEDNWRGPGEVDQGLCDLSMKMACSGKGIGEEHCLPTDGTPGAVCGNGGNCISGSCVDNVCQ